MLIDVVDAKYLDKYKLKITFEDGKTGVVDLSEYPQKGGVFNKFLNISFFKEFNVSKELGTLVWKNEIDIAPETLYEKCEPISSTDG